MKRNRLNRLASLLVLASVVVVAGLMPGLALADGEGSYHQTNLVSDLPNIAQVTDAKLVNPWGLSRNPTGPWWVSDNGTGLSTLYNSAGTPSALVVTIPKPDGTPGGTPTGNIFNSANTTNPRDFVVTANGKSGASLFIFATEDGTISGWNRNVDATHAIIGADQSASGAIYKGLAMGQSHRRNFLYATNFHAGTVDVFDAGFQLVDSFADSRLERMCAVNNECYAPFGIQNIDGNLYVTFALQGADKHDDVPGAGHGFVDVFNTGGRLLRRLVIHDGLNSPWGLALAPDHFGPFSKDLLVGNFGDGRINAYDPETGTFLGPLRDESGSPISIDGLWAIAFGNGGAAGPTNTLFFAAGLNDEANGLFGKIEAHD